MTRAFASASLGAVVLAAAGAFYGCATLANGEAGLDNAPSARAGPFRVFRVGEIGEERAAPYVMDNQELRLHDVSVVDSDGDPATFAVEGYFAASAEGADPALPPSRLVRVPAPDGRSFDRTAELVFESSQTWEGGVVASPCVLADGSSRRLYYAGAGGIGLAESTDGGASFVARDAPIVDAESVAWADGPPRSPGVARLPDDTYVMFFEADRGGVPVIGRATSEDGALWFVDTTGPAIVHGPVGSLDELWVGTPQPVVATSAEGRDILYVSYAARAGDDKQAILMAAAFLDETGGTSLQKSTSAMYTPSMRTSPREPWILRFDDFTLLFATQVRGPGQTDLVVPGAVAPATAELPPAE